MVDDITSRLTPDGLAVVSERTRSEIESKWDHEIDGDNLCSLMEQDKELDQFTDEVADSLTPREATAFISAVSLMYHFFVAEYEEYARQHRVKIKIPIVDRKTISELSRSIPDGKERYPYIEQVYRRIEQENHKVFTLIESCMDYIKPQDPFKVKAGLCLTYEALRLQARKEEYFRIAGG